MIHDLYGEVPTLPSMLLSLPFVWFVGVLFALTVAKEFFLERGAKKASWNIAAVVVAMVLGGIYLMGVFLPCSNVLIERIK